VSSICGVDHFQVGRSQALITHILGENVQAFGFDVALAQTPCDGRIAVFSTPRRNGGMNNSAGMDIGAHQQNRSADGVERDVPACENRSATCLRSVTKIRR